MRKNIFAKIFSMLLTFCLCFTMVGCIGFDYDDIDDEELANMTDEEFDKWFKDSKTVDMYGMKVLYHPDNYDFDKNSRPEGAEDKVNDYYARYGFNIVNYLFYLYNAPETRYFYNGAFGLDDESIQYIAELVPYTYDTSRYTITTTEKYISGETEVKYLVTADSSYKWNWSLPANYNDLSSCFQPKETETQIFDDEEEYLNIINDSYYTVLFNRAYQNIYVGGNSDSEDIYKQYDYDNYSMFSKALTYAIYRYALNLEPEEVVVENSGTTLNVSIGGKSVDNALEEVKTLFNKLGDVVGLDSSQVLKIKNWILNNVIGESALNSPDLTQIVHTQKVNEAGELLYEDEYGNETTTVTNGKEIWIESETKQDLHRNYERTIDAILSKVNKLVSIGGQQDDGVDITDRYLASEITEYAGNMFMVGDDRNFPQMGTEAANKITALPQEEYQSIVFMFSEETKVDSIWVALKYDADFSGTEFDVYGTEYLEISLELNYYSHKQNKVYTKTSPILKVYDGGYDVGYTMLDDDESAWTGYHTCPDYHSSGYAFENLGSLIGQDDLSIDTFNPDIGGGLLKTDVGLSDYNGRPLKSKQPLTLSGRSELKDYYKISEATNEGKTYRTGRLNSEKFSGEDGCDYLEICYRVYKQPGVNKNYKFYTGISNFLTSGTLF